MIELAPLRLEIFGNEKQKRKFITLTLTNREMPHYENALIQFWDEAIGMFTPNGRVDYYPLGGIIKIAFGPVVGEVETGVSEEAELPENAQLKQQIEELRVRRRQLLTEIRDARVIRKGEGNGSSG